MTVLIEEEVGVDFSDNLCSDCKEEGRPDQVLVRLPIVTEHKRIECVACPYCDGKDIIELAYNPR